MYVRGIVTLNVLFHGLDGRRERRKIAFRCFQKGCAQGVGITLGGPDLDPYPLGMGFKPCLGGHLFAALGNLMLPRVEGPVIQRGLAGYAISSISHAEPRDKTPKVIQTFGGEEPEQPIHAVRARRG